MTVAATIEIVPTAPPWLLFARWLKISVEIDGEISRQRWGTHAFAVAPGTHKVSVSLGMAHSRATLEVTIAGNETLRLVYRPGVITNMPGKLEIERVPTARVVPRDDK
jgi:hypothetical protein